MENKPIRPWYLTTVLVLIILYILSNTLFLILFPEGFTGFELQVWYSITSIVFQLLTIIGILTIFWWKKSGFYLATVVSLVSVVIDYIAQPDFIIMTSIFTLLPLVLIYLCMRPVWINFK